MNIDGFNEYKPEDRGTWVIFTEGSDSLRMTARATGRYDAVVRWAVANVPGVRKVLMEAVEFTVVPDDYGMKTEGYPGLPDNWKLQALEAKRAYDVLNNVTTVFILPLSWLEGWVKWANEMGLKQSDGSYWLWGADVHFGPVDKPVAGGMTYRYMEG